MIPSRCLKFSKGCFKSEESLWSSWYVNSDMVTRDWLLSICQAIVFSQSSLGYKYVLKKPFTCVLYVLVLYVLLVHQLPCNWRVTVACLQIDFLPFKTCIKSIKLFLSCYYYNSKHRYNKVMVTLNCCLKGWTSVFTKYEATVWFYCCMITFFSWIVTTGWIWQMWMRQVAI